MSRHTSKGSVGKLPTPSIPPGTIVSDARKAVKGLANPSMITGYVPVDLRSGQTPPPEIVKTSGSMTGAPTPGIVERLTGIPGSDISTQARMFVLVAIAGIVLLLWSKAK